MIYFVSARRRDLAVLERPELGELMHLAVAILALFVVTGWTFYLLVSFVGVKLAAKEWLGLTFLGNALNYLGPLRPGVLLKGYYLKRRRVAYADYSSILAAAFFLTLFATGLGGLLALLVIRTTAGIHSDLLMAVCAGALLLSLLPFVMPLADFRREGKILDFLGRALDGFRSIRDQKGKMFGVVTTVMAQHLVTAWICMVSFRALGLEIDFLTALTLGILVAMSNTLSITPNNLGIQELVMAYVYALTGMDFTEGLVGAGLIRSVHLVLSFVVAPFFLWLLPLPQGWSRSAEGED